jgi:hypothetical protein
MSYRLVRGRSFRAEAALMSAQAGPPKQTAQGEPAAGPPDLLRPIGVAWGAVICTLLLAEGQRLHRFVDTWRPSASETPT